MPVEFRTGRPPHWNNCYDLDFMCEMYFDWCEEENKHPGVCGLAVFLGVDRQTILDYSRRPEFSDTIKKAKGRVEAYLEQCLHSNSVAGTIFNMKNNFGWKDQTQVEQSGPDGGAIKTETKWTVEIVSPDKESR